MLKFRHILPIIIASIINCFLLVVSCYRTNYSITLKGDIVLTSNVIEIENANKIDGSYNTVYVISFNKSTLFQNFISKYISSSSLTKISAEDLHFTDYENYLMGNIQYNSSIMQSIISSFKAAQQIDDSINIDYQLSSLVVTYYYGNSGYQIGDEIVKVDNIPIYDVIKNVEYDSGWLKPIGKTLEIKRGNSIITKVVESSNDYVYVYPYYDINYTTINPNVIIKDNFVGGPSGGFIRSLSLVDSLLDVDLSKGKNIVGTGTISTTGIVGAIGSIKQKVYTAASKNVDIFFCPQDNYIEALEAYNLVKDKTSMLLIPVSSLSEAVEVLLNE